MLQRANWTSLNGRWSSQSTTRRSPFPDAVKWDAQIEVPYAPETPASGVHDQNLYRAVWYRRTFDAPKLGRDQRLLLHLPRWTTRRRCG